MTLTKETRGFSLIELLVAVGILALISSIVLANHSRFNSSVLLGSLAYDIALSIREAQVYGLSVRQSTSGFQVGYGVHFSGSDSYVFFVDDGDKEYNSDDDTIIRTYNLGQGHQIARFCGTGSGGETCSDDASPITQLDIVFFRPEPDAIMTSDEIGIDANSPYSSALIVVSSPNGEERSVEVQSTGQISVKNP